MIAQVTTLVGWAKAYNSLQSSITVPPFGCTVNQQCVNPIGAKCTKHKIKGFKFYTVNVSSLLKRVCVEENQGESYKTVAAKFTGLFYREEVKSQDKTKFLYLYLG